MCVSWRAGGNLSKKMCTWRYVIRAACRAHRPLTVWVHEGITGAMLIFKILRTDEWQTLRREGDTTGAPIDVADGYIHISTAQQVMETAAKHFAGEEGLFLLALETDALGEALEWEVSRGDALFPHLYRKLTMADVVWAQPIPLEDGVHQFPAGLDEASE